MTKTIKKFDRKYALKPAARTQNPISEQCFQKHFCKRQK